MCDMSPKLVGIRGIDLNHSLGQNKETRVQQNMSVIRLTRHFEREKQGGWPLFL